MLEKHQIVIWRYAEIKHYNHRKMIIVYFAVQIMKRRSLPSDGRESLPLRWGRWRALVNVLRKTYSFLVTAGRVKQS